MPIPDRNPEEEAQSFMGRCMSSDVMKDEYPDQKQRVAICTQQSRAGAPKNNLSSLVQEELLYAGFKDECECGDTESNFFVPEDSDKAW